MKKFVSLVLIGLITLALGAGVLIYEVRSRAANVIVAPISSKASSVVAPRTATAATVQGNPTHIDIPSLGMSLDITPGYYNAQSQTWTLTTDKVQYATITPEPNTAGGNTFLYGHYRKNVFASLHQIQPGAQAIITTDNGHRFTYTLVSSKVVSPEDSAGIFDYQGSPILTIQTCTGLFFQNRQLFTFNLAGVQ